jgi:hypothetical protein
MVIASEAADYERFNLARDAVAPWEDGARTDNRRGTMGPRVSREGAGFTRPSRHQSAVRLLMRDALSPSLTITARI